MAVVVPLASVGLPSAARAATYEPGVGSLPLYTFESQALNDRLTVAVNVASGNLLVGAGELQIAGTGTDIALSHFYNSLDTDASTVGNGWSMSVGPDDVKLVIQSSGAVTYHGPGGFKAPYATNADGSFTTPTGMNADLVKQATGTYRLTFRANGTRYEFSSTGALRAMVDRNGNLIAPGYVGSRMAQLSDTQGRVVRLSYGTSGGASGRLTEVADPTGRKYSYAYGTAGTLTRLTDPAGGVTQFAYGANNLLSDITDPLGRVTQISYDSSRRATRIVRIDDPTAGTGPTTRFQYAAGSTTVTDPRSNNTVYAYDSERRVTRTTDALGNARARTYTSNSDSAQDTDALSAISKFSYDSDNRMKSAEQPAASGFPSGLKSLFGYGTDRQSASFFSPTSATDTQGNQTMIAYDAKGNVSSLTNALSAQNTTRYTHNPDGTVATSTDGRGTVTSYGYDAKGNLTSIDRPLPLGDEVFVRDALSRVTRRTDGKAQLTSYTYDALDRIKTITYAGGTSISYDYDANGNIASRTGPDGTTSYTYDRLNRLTQSALPGKTISYTYDAAGNLASLKLPGASSPTTYSYGSTGLLSSMTEPGSKTTSFAHDKTGRRTSTTYPNGVVMTETYDAPGRLRQIKATKDGTTLTDFGYTYTRGANDTNLRQTRTNNAYIDRSSPRATTYSYDALNRLTRAQDTAGGTDDYQYDYDGASNITSQTINGQTRTYAYNSANQLCWYAPGTPARDCGAPPSGAVRFSFDANGNQTAGGANGGSYTYNSADQTTSLRPNSLFNPIPATYRGPGQSDRSLIGSSVEISSVLGLGVSDAMSFGRDNGGRLVSERTSSNDYYFLFDGLGSVVALTNAAGQMTYCYDFAPYGDSQSKACTGVAGGGPPSPWGFAGTQYDVAQRLYKMGERYYDPNTGRWLQQDPIDQTGDQLEGNRYVYAGANPVNYVDPGGELLVTAGRLAYLGGRAIAQNPRVRQASAKVLPRLAYDARKVAEGAAKAADKVGNLFGGF